jgi:hypothetical protein
VNLRLTEQQHGELSLSAAANDRSLQKEIIHRIFGFREAELAEGDESAETGIADASRSDQGVLDGTSRLAPSASSVIKTKTDVVAVLAERGAVAVPKTPRSLPRSAKKEKRRVETGDGRCTAYAAFGTKCKLCGKVHP